MIIRGVMKMGIEKMDLFGSIKKDNSGKSTKQTDLEEISSSATVNDYNDDFDLFGDLGTLDDISDENIELYKNMELDSGISGSPAYHVKDGVFRNLFLNKKYALQLYNVIHPENLEVNENDISYINIDRVLTTDIRNDLAFRVKNSFIYMFEEQTTWSYNMPLRMFLYISEIWKNYIIQNNLNIYKYSAISIPVPEFYVVFTGKKANQLSELSLARDILKNENSPVDLKIKILYRGKSDNDILSQYIKFTKIIDKYMDKKIIVNPNGSYNKAKAHEALKKAINYCIEYDILKDYLISREKEVLNMLDVIYSKEYRDKMIRKSLLEEGREEGRAEGRAEGREEGRAEGRE